MDEIVLIKQSELIRYKALDDIEIEMLEKASKLMNCKRSIASTCSVASLSAIIVSHYTESKKLST